MRVLSVVGARPQFIKAAPVSWAFRAAGIDEFLVHTGQHYDFQMSEVFFRELAIPAPDVNLEVGSASHAQQTASILVELERHLLAESPDLVIVYGDTNSTLAGALTAAKLHIPIAHVEAGLRSFNRAMPEEHNRVLTDHCSELLFCPTANAVNLLEREGITEGVHLVGDTMFDMLQHARNKIRRADGCLAAVGVIRGDYYLATIHRAENTDSVERLCSILQALGDMDLPVVLPLHPRTRSRLEAHGVKQRLAQLPANIRVIDPVGYLDMLELEAGARTILTDSGGVQKEALWVGVPCVTMRTETEWIETVDAGWNVVAGWDRESIVRSVRETAWPSGDPPPLFGDGRAADRIVERVTQQ